MYFANVKIRIHITIYKLPDRILPKEQCPQGFHNSNLRIRHCICCQIEADSFCIAGISGSFNTTTAVKVKCSKVKAQTRTQGHITRETGVLGIYIDSFAVLQNAL